MQIIMNPPLAEIISATTRGIVFVHVGKCAGGSIMRSLRSVLSDQFHMYEMHCFNANQVIRDTLTYGRNDLIYLIAVRDPVSRYISSFNWAKHDQYLRGNEIPEKSGHYCEQYFELFPTVDDLLCALSSSDEKRAEAALLFSNFAHMGMGQSWYTPLSVVKKLPPERTFLCESNYLGRDLRAFSSRMDPETTSCQIKMWHDKGNYSQLYQDGERLFSKTLSSQARRNLRILRDQDFRVYRHLLQHFRKC